MITPKKAHETLNQILVGNSAQILSDVQVAAIQLGMSAITELTRYRQEAKKIPRVCMAMAILRDSFLCDERRGKGCPTICPKYKGGGKDDL